MIMPKRVLVSGTGLIGTSIALALRDKGELGRAYADFSMALQLNPDLTVAREHRDALTPQMARLAGKGQKSHTTLACAAGIKDCNRH